MSDQIPTFKLGDRVRVMATTAMQSRDLANKRGIVTSISQLTASVKIDGEGTTTRQIPFASLMAE